jgi:hypothetical protein
VSTGTEVSLNVGIQFSLGDSGDVSGISRHYDRGVSFLEVGHGAFERAVD